jgi:hypothetical protein
VPALERSTAARQKPAVSANGRQKIKNKLCTYVNTRSRAKRAALERQEPLVDGRHDGGPLRLDGRHDGGPLRLDGRHDGALASRRPS